MSTTDFNVSLEKRILVPANDDAKPKQNIVIRSTRRFVGSLGLGRLRVVAVVSATNDDANTKSDIVVGTTRWSIVTLWLRRLVRGVAVTSNLPTQPCQCIRRRRLY